MPGEPIEQFRLLVRRLGPCAAACLAGLVACVGNTDPLSMSTPQTADAMNAGGAPGTVGVPTGGGGAGGQGGAGVCATTCPSGQTCNAGKCAVCGGFVMSNPVASALPNPASYDTSVAGVVTNTVTGLTWEQTATPGTSDQPTAASYCTNNRTGGLSGWRLPTVTELISLVDFTVPFPTASIDGVAFPGTAADKFWTSTPYLGPSGGPPANAFVIDFGYSRTDSSPVTGNDVAVRVRCVVPSAVRGPSCYAPPRFIVAGTGTSATVTDASTKLVWQRSFSANTMTWDAAKTFCSKTSLRLPSWSELQTIVDYTVPVPEGAIDTAVFPKTPADYFWTSSPAAGIPGKAWIVSFSSGATFTIPTGDTWRVRCVR